MKKLFLFFCFLIALQSRAQQKPLSAGTVLPAAQTPVHDPVMIKQGDTWYLFCTGFGISVWSSRDMKNWKKEPPVFTSGPDWAVKAVPGFKGHIWAPDISFHNGLYYLYYAVSAFGKNTSCIGVAVNKTLDPAAPGFKWEDKGLVVQSVPGRDQWNAIDPNLILDDSGTAWLAFGSFWEGIKEVKLRPDLLGLAEPQQWYTIARRPRTFATPDTWAGDGAIEAPFIFKKGDYYYLFVSFDYCCRGEKSDYKVMVGRSLRATGPFLDKKGVPLEQNGGSLVVQGNKDWYGVGHSATYTFDGKDYLIFHGYDAHDGGKSKLRIEPIGWDSDGWPEIRAN